MHVYIMIQSKQYCELPQAKTIYLIGYKLKCYNFFQIKLKNPAELANITVNAPIQSL